MLIAAAALFALGCGGGGDHATAQPAKPSPSPSATATSTSTPTATAARPGLRLKKIGEFDDPVYVTAPPGDRRRIFVVEQGGNVRIVRGGNKLDRPFLDVSNDISTGGERGLLSLAFAPDYASSGLLLRLLHGADGDIRIVEYRRASAERADHDSARVVLSVSHPAGNHNGGSSCSGPTACSTPASATAAEAATSTAPGNGQNRSTLLGKILRIDPRRAAVGPYRVPSGNPYAGRSGGRPEIFAYGLRNPWRFSFTPNGNLVVGDVGQGAVEEITVVRAQGREPRLARLGGPQRATRRARRAPGHVPPAHPALPLATATARSPAASWCATRCYRRCAAATCSATSAAARSSRRACAGTRRAASAPRGSRSTACPRSARTPAGAST